MKIRTAVVGLGKMGASHLAILNAHPEISVEAVCDPASYILDVIQKYTGLRGFTDYEKMLRAVELDAVLIATPTRLHVPMVERALTAGLHTFCEKPFCLDPGDGARLVRLAEEKGVVNQVGYHCRFVGAFREMKRLLDRGALGNVSHVLAEAYGPVVLRPKGSTWRSRQSDGGGCLLDYAAHPLNLLTWAFGAPTTVAGSTLNKVFSRHTEDVVCSTLGFASGMTAQLSANWSDESCRKMITKITAWGENGRIFADRQECQVYLRDPAPAGEGYREGWNVRYTTDLTESVWFYLRGEEYSSQVNSFVRNILDPGAVPANTFASALETDRVMAMIMADASSGPPTIAPASKSAASGKRMVSRLLGRKPNSLERA